MGLVVGGILGVVVVTGGTHGWSVGSDDRMESHESFLVFTLYDTVGTPAEVAAVKRWWEVRLYSAAVVVGSVVGLAVALRRTRRRP